MLGQYLHLQDLNTACFDIALESIHFLVGSKTIALGLDILELLCLAPSLLCLVSVCWQILARLFTSFGIHFSSEALLSLWTPSSPRELGSRGMHMSGMLAQSERVW